MNRFPKKNWKRGGCDLQLLLDTHALIWWAGGHPSLSSRARTVLRDANNEVFVSAASAWEFATKYRLGKIRGGAALASDFEGYLRDQHFRALPISVTDALRAGSLEGDHRDPFDRMLIAQAQSAPMTVVSIDRIFDRYGVERVW